MDWWALNEPVSFANCFERDESVNELGSVISVSCLDVYLGKDTVTLMVSQAKYDLLNHAVNLLCGLFSSSNVQWPSQHYTTTHFCCFLKKNTMPSIFNLFFFFLFLGLSKDIGTQCTLCVLVVVVAMSKQCQMECLELESLIDAPMQSDPRFWSFKLEEQRAGTTFTICIETLDCYFLLCFVLSIQRRRHPVFTRIKSQWEVGLSQNSIWDVHATHSFKNSVQSAKLTVLKVFQKKND